MPAAEARLRRWYDTASGQPDRYITALPFLPAPATAVKEQNTGAIYSSSPSHGMVRWKGEAIGDVCVGDSVEYMRGRVLSYGRVIGLMLSEEVEGLAAKVRRLMTREQIIEEEPAWVDVPQGRGLWEMSWEETVGVHMIQRVVAVRSTGGGDMVLQGTVDEAGECEQPYRSLASWEEPWRAEGGRRTQPLQELMANVERGLPIVTVSITEWWDKFQTFRRGQVRSK